MAYLDVIRDLTKKVNRELVDLSSERTRGTPPTQVSSEFLTNKEQGDWAEHTLMRAINAGSEQYVAVKYGRDDDIIAGEAGFKDFYEAYQQELDTIGKRPDLLVFDKKDLPPETDNISRWPLEELNTLVPRAKCGIEVRSSAFCLNQYEAYMAEQQDRLLTQVMECREDILSRFSGLLAGKDDELYRQIERLDRDNARALSYRVPTWKSPDLAELRLRLKELKDHLNRLEKRSFLSITPKVEDLKVVYRWIETYQVPHYYVQVFFDSAYGISYEKILRLLSDPSLKGTAYFVESDVKNQNKTTIKINAGKEANILSRIGMPEHHSAGKELGRGRLLFYVKFEDSAAVINKEGWKDLFGFELL